MADRRSVDLVGPLNVANANLNMALALLTAPDEGRVQADTDRRRNRRGLDRGYVAKLLADVQGMPAQRFVARGGLDGQKIRQHAGGDPIRHQGGKMRVQLIQRPVSNANSPAN
jgi:hypothetical protein